MGVIKDDMVGKRFGKLIVISFAYTRNRNAYWNCLCDCGNTSIVTGSKLRRSDGTRSCGCVQRKQNGASTSSEYRVWKEIKGRCYNPNNHAYSYYGGRGITMCDRWLKSFHDFYADMGSRPSPKHTIDRIDNNSSYSPDNCRWATRREQSNNTRWNHNVTYQGITLTISEWSRKLGISRQRIQWRVDTGRPLDQVFSQEKPPRYLQKITYCGITRSILDWSKELSIPISTIRGRIYCGMPIEDILSTKSLRGRTRTSEFQHAS